MPAKQRANSERPHKSERPISHQHHLRNAKKQQEIEDSLEGDVRDEASTFAVPGKTIKPPQR
ncbi:MAG TPA: hypothetical protein VKX17_12990 [Planctomycetota bacterium]|nr:hypothetical protein [Planctomycetota bacterium]